MSATQPPTPAPVAVPEGAVERVLSLHAPVDVEPSATICAGCSTVRGSGESLRFFPAVEWPCETVLAVRRDGDAPRPEPVADPPREHCGSDCPDYPACRMSERERRRTLGPLASDAIAERHGSAPVADPLPSEAALKAAAKALHASRLFWGTHPDRWSDRDWQETFWAESAEVALTAALPHLRLVPEDDEDTVRVPREAVERLRPALYRANLTSEERAVWHDLLAAVDDGAGS